MAAYYKPIWDHSLAFAKEVRYGFRRKQRKEKKKSTYHTQIVIIVELVNETQVHMVKSHMEDRIEVYIKHIVQVMTVLHMVESHMDMMLHKKDVKEVMVVYVHKEVMIVVDMDMIFRMVHKKVMQDMIVDHMKKDIVRVHREDMIETKIDMN